MNAASQLKRVMAGLRQAQPLDPPQSLTLHPNGRAHTIGQWGTVLFDSFDQIERHIDFAQGKDRNENLQGDGI